MSCGDGASPSRMYVPIILLIDAGVKGLNLPAKMCPSSPAFTRSTFALEYATQFKTANLSVLSPFTSAFAESSKLSAGVSGRREFSQSIGWLFSSIPYFLRWCLLGSPLTRGSCVSQSCFVGERSLRFGRFLDREFFRGSSLCCPKEWYASKLLPVAHHHL